MEKLEKKSGVLSSGLGRLPREQAVLLEGGFGLWLSAAMRPCS